MTRSAVARTDALDSAAAGRELGGSIVRQLGGDTPHAVILFASPRHDFGALLAALEASCAPGVLVGASSAGEFTSDSQGVGLACAVALHAPEMRFAAALGRGLSVDRSKAAHDLVAGLHGLSRHDYAHRTAIVLTDALAGHADELVDEINTLTGGVYTLCGGGAGGDDSFERRFVFHGTEAVPDAAVALEVLSDKPIGVGAQHGWQPNSETFRVTEADGVTLGSLNAIKAADVMEAHAERTGQAFDRAAPLPFFLHNVLGVDTGAGHKLRVPLGIGANGSLTCANEVPRGASVQVMDVTKERAAAAAAASVQSAIGQLEGRKPAVALFFDCVATRLRMGTDFGFELDAVQSALGEAKFAGCNSIGQIARVEGQSNGFHNCTAVVCVFPE
jgi:hypothetical protein